MNASSEDKFNQYTKYLLQIGQGKHSLFQLVNDMIKNKESYVGYVIDHTTGSCCQSGSSRSTKSLKCSNHWKRFYW